MDSDYTGTPMEGMDAFQRQLKHFDIKTRSMDAAMLLPAMVEAMSGPYSTLGLKLVVGRGRNDVQHRQTCPVCGGRLVNLYRRNQEWKCRKCWEGGLRHGG